MKSHVFSKAALAAAATAVVMTAAPANAETWKALLMRGETNPTVAQAIGQIQRHLMSAQPTGFEDQSFFDDLRLDPYYRFTASRHPELAPFFAKAIDACRRPIALTHGDWSPKNIMVAGGVPLALDFEWMNRNLFSGLYTRTTSFFDNSELASTGRPASSAERALLAPYPGVVREDILEGRWRPYRTDGTGRDRTQARVALDLLAKAGWRIDGGELENNGEPFEFEIMVADRNQERLALNYASSLRRIGVVARVRTVDEVQYQRRRQRFDFDMMLGTWTASASPGNEQRMRWGSASASQEASFNLAGASSPAIDALIAEMLAANSHEDFVTAVRAYDRVLLSGFYIVPLFHTATQWDAYWTRIERPDTLPRWAAPGLAVALLYTTPGLLLLRLLWPRERALGYAERLALAIGASVALPPLLLLLFQQLGLPWGATATWAYLVLCSATWAVLALRGWRNSNPEPTPIRLAAGHLERTLLTTPADADGLDDTAPFHIEGDDVFVDHEALTIRFTDKTYAPPAAAAAGSDGKLRAPMDGKIVAIKVAAGDTVTRGQTLVVLTRNIEVRIPMKSVDRGSTNDVEFVDGMQWSLGFMVSPQALPSGRSEGSLSWAGLANTYYWIDPKAQIAAILATQLFPFADGKVLSLLQDFERLVYANLVTG